MIHKIVTAVLGVAVLVLGFMGVSGNDAPFGGVTNFDSITLGDNLVVGGTISSTDNITATGGIVIGSSGTEITKHLSATSSVDLPAITKAGCGEATTSFAGVLTTDSFRVTAPNNLMATDSNIFLNGWVSDDGTVTLRLCPATDSVSIDPEANEFIFDAWRHPGT